MRVGDLEDRGRWVKRRRVDRLLRRRQRRRNRKACGLDVHCGRRRRNRRSLNRRGGVRDIGNIGGRLRQRRIDRQRCDRRRDVHRRLNRADPPWRRALPERRPGNCRHRQERNRTGKSPAPLRAVPRPRRRSGLGRRQSRCPGLRRVCPVGAGGKQGDEWRAVTQDPRFHGRVDDDPAVGRARDDDRHEFRNRVPWLARPALLLFVLLLLPADELQGNFFRRPLAKVERRQVIDGLFGYSKW